MLTVDRMFDNGSSAQEIVGAYHQLLFRKYCVVASSALLWFDFALTFPTEVERIWGHRFSSAMLVYLFTRYAAIVDRVIWYEDEVMVTLEYLGFSAFTTLGVCGSVWGPDWRPLAVVLPLTLIRPALYIYEITQYTSPQVGAPSGCVYDYTMSTVATISIDRLYHIASATTIASNAILVCLTWAKTFSIHKVLSRIGVRTRLITLLLRDGTAFFIILLLSRTLVVISNNVQSTSLVLAFWPYFDNVLSPIFLSRFLLNVCGLRFSDHRSHMGIPYGDSTTSATFEMSEIRFTASRALGNLGPALSDPGTSRPRRNTYNIDIEGFSPELSGPPGITETVLSERAL